jgi:hypothetical protein
MVLPGFDVQLVRPMKQTIIACAMSGVLASAAAGGSVLYVDDDGPAGGDGATWKSAYRFLQDALTAAQQPGSGINEIRVAQGAYKPDHSERNPDGTQDQAATFSLIDQVAIKGGYAGIVAPDPDTRDPDTFESILSGQIFSVCIGPTFVGSHHVVSSMDNAASAILDGFTITCGGNISLGGSGIVIVDGSPIVIDCTFANNATQLGNGGAALVEHAAPAFFNCTFVENANYEGQAAGIYSSMSNLVLVQCEFIAHFCQNALSQVDGTNALVLGCKFDSNDTGPCGAGAGVVNVDSSILIADTYFVNNIDEGNGAMGNLRSNVHVVDCTFEQNDGEFTGAINSAASTIVIEGCNFIDNFGAGGVHPGGAIRNTSCEIIIDSCAFMSNGAGSGRGGAIDNVSSDAIIVNCMFTGNSAVVGSAINNTASDPLIVNCTFSNNLLLAGSLSTVMYSDAESAATVFNCIVWNHDDPAFGGPGEVTFAYRDIEDGVPPGIGNISADPMFVDADGPDNTPGTIDDNLRLLPGSPCIDAGDNTAVPADEFDLDADGDTVEPIPFDLAGLPRFLDDPATIDTGNGTPPIVDMGAYEFNCGNNALDLTGDGVVDAADLAQLLADWGACPDCPADSTGDGVVDAADLAAMLANWC